MNREALRHWFDNEAEIRYDEKDKGFVIRTSMLSADTLKEIGACGAAVRDHDFYGQWWVVPDE